jgi:hypothetical protein
MKLRKEDSLSAMAQWRNGAMAQWRNGAMAQEVSDLSSVR